jgi:predicted  nucleic acid-binding Zn-ribbon protein
LGEKLMSKSEKLRREIDARKERLSALKRQARKLKGELASAEAKERRGKALALGHVLLERDPKLAEKLALELTGARERALFGLPPIGTSQDLSGTAMPADDQ